MIGRREALAGGLATILSAGCLSRTQDRTSPTAEGAAAMLERDFSFGGVRRSYLLHIPKNHDRQQAAPLLLVLHGGGGNAAGMARIMDTHAKAARVGMVTAYPQSLNTGFNAGPGVDGKSANFGPSVTENVDDVGYISNVIDDIGRQTSIDPSRVFAAGWSNGSAMSFRLAVELSNRIAAVAGNMSELSLMDPLTLPRPVPMMYFWGTEDPIRRPGALPKDQMAQRNIDRLLRLDECDLRPVETKSKGKAVMRRWVGAKPGAEVVEWRLNGFGHFWPGLSVGVDQRDKVIARYGPIETEVNATDELLAFFATHPMPK